MLHIAAATHATWITYTDESTGDGTRCTGAVEILRHGRMAAERSI